ncbi:hypothetical protein [Microbacterium sp. TNHR37B]|uniref:hypothetical protein n=1 Tax=Microbacterium sp. TNHR37B TaxID=1775956 RepID=UPI0007B2D71A|nr:hypothetical protein [Microbacterium sp. TNHR37B]KZE89787.1 hypothetical protein AVP41_02589 [Microbacterium sp. TNHR37B]
MADTASHPPGHAGTWQRIALSAVGVAFAWLALSLLFGLGAAPSHAADDNEDGRGILGAVTGLVDDATGDLTDATATTTETVTDTTSAVVEKTTSTVTAVTKSRPAHTATSTVTKAVRSAPVVGKVVEKTRVADAVDSVADTVDKVVDRTAEHATTVVSGATKAVESTVDTVVGAVTDMVDSAVDTVVEVVDTSVDAVTPPLPSPGTGSEEPSGVIPGDEPGAVPAPAAASPTDASFPSRTSERDTAVPALGASSAAFPPAAFARAGTAPSPFSVASPVRQHAPLDGSPLFFPLTAAPTTALSSSAGSSPSSGMGALPVSDSLLVRLAWSHASGLSDDDVPPNPLVTHEVSPD